MRMASNMSLLLIRGFTICQAMLRMMKASDKICAPPFDFPLFLPHPAFNHRVLIFSFLICDPLIVSLALLWHTANVNACSFFVIIHHTITYAHRFIKRGDGKVFIGTVWPGTTAFPDFLHDNSTAYWTQMVQTFLSTVPIDGLWIDSMTSCEPSPCIFW
jgi:hypothetical protein